MHRVVEFNFCGSFISSSILVQSHRVPIEKMLGHAVAFRPVVRGGSVGAKAPPDFCRSVNPISTRGQIMSAYLIIITMYLHLWIFRPADGPATYLQIHTLQHRAFLVQLKKSLKFRIWGWLFVKSSLSSSFNDSECCVSFWQIWILTTKDE